LKCYSSGFPDSATLPRGEPRQASRYDKAIADYSKAIELKPKNVVAWNNRGSAYVYLHQYDKAVADLTKAIELDPKTAAVWNNRGHAFAGLGQWDKASADFSMSVALNPEVAPPWQYRALLYLERGDRDGFRKTCAAMRQHFAASGNPEAVYWTAWTCIQVRDAVKVET
jgi:tetratricopeptide (TPR) repeat protein